MRGSSVVVVVVLVVVAVAARGRLAEEGSLRRGRMRRGDRVLRRREWWVTRSSSVELLA